MNIGHQESEEMVTISDQKSRSRHLIDLEIVSAIDLIPTSNLSETMLMESRENQEKMIPKIDVTEMFPVTFEERVVPSGSSAGGGLAAVLALYIRDQKEFEIHHLRLRSPMLDDRTGIWPEHPYAGEYVWTKRSNYFGWKSVLVH
ncbi:hypothetical protein BRE01_36680 [Brevibacillus reuszeri]|uniref:Alpha/beta hydrolase fold-3 domain-containing protein n=2 Tax=Brevibacillus reuszeri TaxID=54915 RepID=A0ABQ0TQ57_9BACL|nr:hypothetical protein BRE01_36680 [Brevibacillus reuszeri]